MKGLILLADYFEDIEAIATIDLLRRAHITIDMVSVTKSYQLKTQSQISINADYLIEDINLDDYSFVVLPGGKAVYLTHLSSSVTMNVLNHFYKKGELVASICAAPMVLGKMGLLNDLPFTCFPSCEQDIPGFYKNTKVEVIGNIITSKAAGTTFEFAYQIIKYLLGTEKAEEVIKQVYYKEG